MFEKDQDSQTAFGLTLTKPVQESIRPIEPQDPWARMNQVEFSLSRLERLPQSFIRVAQFFRDGSAQEGDKLLKHCLESLSQLFNQWPLNADQIENSLAVTRRIEATQVIREICRFREIRDIDSIADCIEDELVMKLRGCETALRTLLKRYAEETY